jgi:o-succinylbenzoate---CoA ligase
MCSPSHPLIEAAERFSDEVAIFDATSSYTYQHYCERAQSLAAGLTAAGLKPGAVLGISLPPSADYAALLMACTMAGIVAAPLDPKLPPVAIGTGLKALGAGTLITSKPEDAPCGVKILVPKRGTDPSERVPERDGAKQGFIRGFREDGEATDVKPESPSGATLKTARSWGCPGRVEDTPKASECLEGGTRKGSGPRAHGSDASAKIAILTSGSTGTPKASVLSQGNLCANAAASNDNIPVAPGDRWLLSLPLHHVAGLGILFRCLLGGGTVVIPDKASGILAAIREHGITHVSLVATQLFRLMESPEATEALRGLNTILLGGSAIPDALVRRAMALGLPVRRSYGLSEMATQVTTTRAVDPPEALFTSGRPLDPDAITLADDGEILVRGPCLFRGYLVDGRQESPATTDGWFATGDLGEWDAYGNLVVLGRKDNMFVSGGENIQPEEIERQLQAIDGVLEAVVVPVDDAEFGARPVAFVRTEGELDAEALLAALAVRLPRFKLPKAVLPWPKTGPDAGMKVSRAELAEAAGRLEA